MIATDVRARTSAALLAVLLLAACQGRGTPRHPDLSGVWRTTERFQAGVLKSGVLPLRPDYQAQLEAAQKVAIAGGAVPANAERCIPSGMPMMMWMAFEILPPGRKSMVILSEGRSQARLIWLDGRALKPEADAFDTFSGQSVGHWEGHTLVVETNALRDLNEITYGLRAHKMTMIERFRLSGPDQLQIEVTITDPVALTKPYVRTLTFKRDASENLEEVYCVPALDRSVDSATGQQGFDLTAPAGGFDPNAK